MKVLVNDQVHEIKIASIITLMEVISQIEKTLPQGYIITDIILNEKSLGLSWIDNASKTYLLDEDNLCMVVEDSTAVGTGVLTKSKALFSYLIDQFSSVADSFRLHDETEANKLFLQSIDDLREYNNIIQEAASLLGRPLDSLTHGNVQFHSYINTLADKLDLVIKTQSEKDWVMLADLIEYEMIPALKNLGHLYDILGI
jgi:ATP-dependent exoDNAse (exonuclease V) alpha subunit